MKEAIKLTREAEDYIEIQQLQRGLTFLEALAEWECISHKGKLHHYTGDVPPTTQVLRRISSRSKDEV